MDIKGLKIGIPTEYYCDQLSQEVLDVWNDIAQILEKNGAIVKKVILFIQASRTFVIFNFSIILILSAL